LKAVAKGRKGILGDDDFVKCEKVLGVDFGCSHEQITLNIASCKEGRLRELISDDQRATNATVSTFDQFVELFGAGLLDFEGLNGEYVTGKNTGAKSLTESETLDGLRGLLGVTVNKDTIDVVGLWTMDNATTDPDWGAGITGARGLCPFASKASCRKG
jgi:hypothetical protein